MDGNSPEQGQPKPEGPQIPKQPGREEHPADVLPPGVDNKPPTENKPQSTEEPTETPQGEGIASLPGQLGKGDTLDQQPPDTIADVAKEMPESHPSDEQPVVLGAPEPRGAEHDDTTDEQVGSTMEDKYPDDEERSAIPTQQGGTPSGFQRADSGTPPDERLQDEIGIPGDRPPESGGDKITAPVEEMPTQLENVPLGPEEPVKPGAIQDPTSELPNPRYPEDDNRNRMTEATANLQPLEGNVAFVPKDEQPTDEGNETHGSEGTANEEPNTDAVTSSTNDEPHTEQPKKQGGFGGIRSAFRDFLMGQAEKPPAERVESVRDLPPTEEEPTAPEEPKDGEPEPDGNGSGTPPPTNQ